MEGVININILKIGVNDKEFPNRLRKIGDFPTELYAVGNIKLLNATSSIAIVGARNCTDYGRKVTKEFSREISKYGICIVSGLAIGIDSIAHREALEKKGKTIAVLGGGFNHIYPRENEWLFYKILENDGCIISEFSPDVYADKKNFPRRNRIISGISDGALVVEAAFRSGSSITARYTKSQGKPVYSIPNSIYENTGIGTNNLIKEGAELVTKPKDIIEKMKLKGKEQEDEEEVIEEDTTIKISEEYLQIYSLLSDKPTHINELAIKLNKSIQEISPTIILMELEGYIEQIEPNCYIRKKEKI